MQRQNRAKKGSLHGVNEHFEFDFNAAMRPSLASRKLEMLDAAGAIEDLRSPPGNRLEVLSGNRASQHSIRINDQWRVCFVWREGHAHEVEIVDYH